jgi:hypothetical protein
MYGFRSVFVQASVFAQTSVFVTNNEKYTTLLQNLSIFRELRICNAWYYMHLGTIP